MVDDDGRRLFEAAYDAWGKQERITDTIGFLRGYTGHEMLPEFGLINMNGRVYDPMLGRFLSPDSYVQMPDNTQSFNRYSYCINNPLKYVDPSGELFGIDDIFIAFAAFNIASSMMQAAFNGENIWKAGGLSLLSSVASYGVGAAFGSAGTFGHELLRAGAHGLSGGVVGALSGDNFFSSAASGMGASLMGSYAQVSKLSPSQLIAGTTVMGGALEWVTGGNFFSGAMRGLAIGALNFAEHDIIEYHRDKSGNIYGNVSAVEVTGHRHLEYTSHAPTEKPLGLIYPEFGMFCAMRMVITVATSSISSFFTNTAYTTKVQQQMVRGVGEFHSFPKGVEAFGKDGFREIIKGRDGEYYEILKIHGSYPNKHGMWYDGYFEFIKDKNGLINLFNTRK